MAFEQRLTLWRLLRLELKNPIQIPPNYEPDPSIAQIAYIIEQNHWTGRL